MSWTNFVDVPREWPRRLLHIPSMTSVERQANNTYAGICEPTFAVLSYTWGRWSLPNGPRLPVKGVTWQLPAIDEVHFKIQDLQKLIEDVIGDTYDFVWIDVACIDQEDRVVKMDEIGRQVGIFASAAKAFVWLSHLPGLELCEAIDYIANTAPLLSRGWRSHLQEGVAVAVTRLCGKVSFLLSDPWFSSLWTLQEAVLRADAEIICQEGYSINLPPSDCLLKPEDRSLKVLIHCFWQLTHDLQNLEEERDLDFETVGATVKMLHRSGLNYRYGHSNPNIQYSAAAHRTTSNELDRIYGIISIYNIKVGEAAGHREGLTLGELEDEFAFMLNLKSSLLGQLFLHSKKPKEGKTWRITQDCIVLEHFRFSEDFRSLCSLTRGDAGQPLLRGPLCSLKRVQKSVWSRAYNFHIELDHHILDGKYRQPSSMIESAFSRKGRAVRLIDACETEWGADRVSVLQLAAEADRSFNGLVLLHSECDYHEVVRVGVCDWSILDRGTEQTQEHPGWDDFLGTFL